MIRHIARCYLFERKVRIFALLLALLSTLTTFSSAQCGPPPQPRTGQLSAITSFVDPRGWVIPGLKGATVVTPPVMVVQPLPTGEELIFYKPSPAWVNLQYFDTDTDGSTLYILPGNTMNIERIVEMRVKGRTYAYWAYTANTYHGPRLPSLPKVLQRKPTPIHLQNHRFFPVGPTAAMTFSFTPMRMVTANLKRCVFHVRCENFTCLNGQSSS